MLQKAINISPRNKNYLSKIAFVYRMKKQYNEAVTYYRKALEIKEDAFTYSGLAEVYEEISEYDKALECLHEANRIWKSDFFDEQIASIYLKQNNYREAIEIYRNLLEKNPNNTSARFHLAVSLSNYGKRYEAILEYLKLIEIDPKDNASHYNLGLLYMEDKTKESLQEAIKHFNISIAETPEGEKNVWALRAKGLIRICNERIEEIEYPEKIRELSKQSGEVGFIASLLLAKEDYTKGNNLFISGEKNTEPVLKDSYYSKDKIVTEYIVSPDIFEAQALFKKFEEKISDLKKKDDKYSDILNPFLKAAKNRIEGIEIYSKGYYLLKKDYRGEFEKGFGMIKVADSYFLEGLRNLATLMKKYKFFTAYDVKRIFNSIDYYENKYKK
jgi:tetratricopeptide (TPR) repeat protein